MAVIRRRAKEEDDPLILPDRTALTVLSADLTGSRILYRGQEIFIPLPGPHQVLNTITAVEALNALSSSRFALPPSAIAARYCRGAVPRPAGTAAAVPPVLLDGAHNPNGGRALCDAVKSLGLHDLTAVVGMLRDKDCLPVLRMMAPYCARMIVTTVPNPRSYPAEEFAELAAGYAGISPYAPTARKPPGWRWLPPGNMVCWFSARCTWLPPSGR